MVTGIIGRKIGMTQVFDPDGTVHPATVIKAGPCVVVQAKNAQTDGYEAVQLGLVEERPAKVGKPLAGHYKKAGVPPTRVRREVSVATGGDALKAGDQVLVDIFANGERVDVIGTGRGKGFQGVVRRHHFAGGAATHGSMFHRAPGSIGASSFPSRVVKGMRAAGRMGGGRVTIHNLKVLRVDPDNHLLIVEGGIPGAPTGYVVIRKAVTAEEDQGGAGREAEEGKEVGHAARRRQRQQREDRRGRPSRRRVRRADQHRSHLGVGGARQRGGAAGHARDQEPGARQRQRQEAVAAEGHRPRARRRNPQSAVAEGRHRVRAAAAQLRLPAAEEGRARRAAGGAGAEAARTARSWSSTRWRRRRSRPRRRRRC